jgi:uncharacterized repeat protein (TIGR02543 family)
VPQALTANGFTNPNATFSGWSLTPGGSFAYANTQTITVTGSETLYAIWTPITYTVTFSSSVGAGSTPSETFSAGVPQALTANGFTNPNATFSGWSLTPGGSFAYANTQTITVTDSETLYAIWTPNATVTVSFNSEGGATTPASQSGLIGTKITLPAAPTYAGHTFKGWYLAASGGAALTSPYTLTSTLMLYAQWTPNATVTVSFNSEGGATTPAGQSGLIGTTITLPAAPTYAGHTFNGWFLTTSGGTALTSPYLLTATLTLYAQWTSVKASTSTSLSLNVSTRTYGDEDDVIYSVNVTGGSSTPTGTVTILWGTTTLCTITLHNGSGQCSAGNTVLPAGPQSITASYSGDSSHNGSTSSPQSLNISKDGSKMSVSESASNAVVGSEGSVLFTAKVTSNNGEPIPSGESVLIHVGSASCIATTNGSGLASCSISGLLPGNNAVSATYAGDSNIIGSSSTNSLNFAVWAAPSITSVNTTFVAVGQLLSFQVTSTGFPTPTYSISGTLPHGVSFNAATGVLSGSPSHGTTGTYSVTITASNAAGTTSQTFHLVVTAH